MYSAQTQFSSGKFWRGLHLATVSALEVSASPDAPAMAATAAVGTPIAKAALGREDRWSDIDLALCVAADAGRAQVIADWTDRMYGEQGAVHHVDVYSGETLYRVFLLLSTLQVDISFWVPSQFGALGPSFRLLFGTAAMPSAAAAPTVSELIGMGWLYALHARSSIARGRVWQAEYMISGVRDQVLALACLRHDVPAVQGRGMDSLPRNVTAPIARALVASLDVAELKRAFAAVTEALLVETDRSDPGLADRLAEPLRDLAS